MSNQLKGKVALITGANSGIGRAAALLFTREGAKVIVGARNAEQGEAVAREAREGAGEGGDATFLRIDVAETGAMQRAVEETVALFGGLHIAFNNAGINGPTGTNLTEQTEEAFDEVINVNLKAVFMAMKAQIPAIKASGGGAIVNTSSVGGVIGNYGLSPYIASKHGVIGLTRAAALEYAQEGVRVNAITPGATETPMLSTWMEQPGVRDMIEESSPMGRLGTPEEVANAALWLASDASSFVTGAVIAVDGAYTTK